MKDKVMRFEDQFQNANRELESLHQEIDAHEHNLVTIEKNNLEGSEGENTQKHAEMRRKFQDFKDKYIKLKNEFREFLKDLI
jgi:chromosome segregation ATPase